MEIISRVLSNSSKTIGQKNNNSLFLSKIVLTKIRINQLEEIGRLLNQFKRSSL
jgi:hypothetical protein